MEVKYYQEENAISPRLIILIVLSALFMLITAYISNVFIVDLERFSLQPKEQQAYILFSAIGLPLVSLIVSQLLVAWRGLKNAVNAVFYSSLFVLVGQAPLILYMLA